MSKLKWKYERVGFLVIWNENETMEFQGKRSYEITQ